MYFQYGEKEINYLKSNGWQIKKSDEEAIQELCALKGIGVWTAEMILLFCLQHPDILSYNDLQFSGVCAWFTITGRLPKSFLQNTNGVFRPAAVSLLCIFGQSPAAPLRVCGIKKNKLQKLNRPAAIHQSQNVFSRIINELKKL